MNLQELKTHLTDLKKKYPKNVALSALEVTAETVKVERKIKKTAKDRRNRAVPTMITRTPRQITTTEDEWSYISLDDASTAGDHLFFDPAEDVVLAGTQLAKIAAHLDQIVGEEVEVRKIDKKQAKQGLQKFRKALLKQTDAAILYRRLKDTEAFENLIARLEAQLNEYLQKNIAEDRKIHAKLILTKIADLKANTQYLAPKKFTELLQTLLAVRAAVAAEDEKHWHRNALTGGRLNNYVTAAIKKIENSPSKFVQRDLSAVTEPAIAREFFSNMKQQLEDYQSSFFHTHERKIKAKALLAAIERNINSRSSAEEQEADFFSELYQTQIATLARDQQRNILAQWFLSSENDALSGLVAGAIHGILVKAESSYALAQAIIPSLQQNIADLHTNDQMAGWQQQLADFYITKLEQLVCFVQQSRLTDAAVSIYEDPEVLL